MKFTVEEFRAKLPLPAAEKWKDDVWDVEAFKKGTVSLILFAPKAVDYQTFHEEDEFYFVARGQGELIIGNERFACAPGDSFFVAAKTVHNFENFSDDFAAWAVFF
jgi:mannose-6-phosphate isomerase-like protein (cupin superfamily)